MKLVGELELLLTNMLMTKLCFFFLQIHREQTKALEPKTHIGGERD